MKAVLTIFFGLLLLISWGQDTINQTDSAGLKQGQWLIKNDSKRPDYSKDAIIEKGQYVNNKKEGLWTTYYPNGNIKMELTYMNNRPDGYCKLYYENGCINEEGIWKNNRWDTATYKLYGDADSCGKIMPSNHKFKFNETGKREGEQVYGLQGKRMLTLCSFPNDTVALRQFQELVDTADKLFNEKKYEAAQTTYQNACKMCCDTYLEDRLKLIEEILKKK